jgi:hypothetical protein
MYKSGGDINHFEKHEFDSIDFELLSIAIVNNKWNVMCNASTYSFDECNK